MLTQRRSSQSRPGGSGTTPTATVTSQDVVRQSQDAAGPSQTNVAPQASQIQTGNDVTVPIFHVCYGLHIDRLMENL